MQVDISLHDILAEFASLEALNKICNSAFTLSDQVAALDNWKLLCLQINAVHDHPTLPSGRLSKVLPAPIRRALA